MGENSKIEWCSHTFNPWVGCQKVSPGCDNCYAETMMDQRWGKVEWGPTGERKRTSKAYWKQPSRWAWQAVADGTRPRVFCASLADVFDNQVPDSWRSDLFDVIADTPELDWLLLTKRPQNIRKMLPPGDIYPNIWIGTSAENQEEYERRFYGYLYDLPCVRFVSYEPALGPLEIDGPYRPDWIICGGESGPQARPMHPGWARSIRDQCKALRIPFFFKQWGEHYPQGIGVEHAHGGPRNVAWPDGTIGDGNADQRGGNGITLVRVGKKAAGRLLDGVEYSEFPRAAPQA